MIEITTWMNDFLHTLNNTFADRVWFVGLQGSYGRGEATEKSEDILRGLYKSASFIVQAIAFKQTEKYISHQKDLLQFVSPDEQAVVETFLDLKNGKTIDFDKMSETLLNWSKKWIEKTK